MKGYLFLILCTIAVCTAEFVEDEKSLRIFHPRKAKHHLLFPRKGGYSEVYFNPLHGVGFLGGLQSLVALFVLKVKIVLVVITIIGATVLALKFLGVFKYSNYLYKSNYPAAEPPVFDYAGYPPSIVHDYKLHDEHDWSSPPSHYRDLNRHSTADMMNDLLQRAEEVLLPLMNFSNRNCRDRAICQLSEFITSSLNFSKCREMYADCGEHSATRKRRRRRNVR